MSVTELPLGTEFVFAENRDVESIFKSDKNVIADHVWTTCRPTPKFSSSTPTVTARRIQMVRVQLQSNLRLMETWEAETPTFNEAENEDEDTDESSSPGQYSTDDSRKKSSQIPSASYSDMRAHQYSRRSGSPQERSLSSWSGNVSSLPFDVDTSRNVTSQNSSACFHDPQSRSNRRGYQDKSGSTSTNAPSTQCSSCISRTRTDERISLARNGRILSSVCTPNANAKTQQSMASSELKIPSMSRGAIASASNGCNKFEQEFDETECPPEEKRESYDCNDWDKDDGVGFLLDEEEEDYKFGNFEGEEEEEEEEGDEEAEEEGEKSDREEYYVETRGECDDEMDEVYEQMQKHDKS